MKNDIHTIWAVLCESSSIDQTSNNISLYKVVEQLNLTRDKNAKIEEGAITAAPLGFEFVILFQRSGPKDKKVTFPISMRISDPTGRTLQELPIPATFEEGKLRHRIIIKNNAVPVTVAGEYSFQVMLDNVVEPLAQIPLEVVIN